MEKNPSSSSRTTDRKFIERNRRYQTKALYSKLKSLVPHHQTPTEASPLPVQLEEATNYIKKLQTKLEKMKEKKENLIVINDQMSNSNKQRKMKQRSSKSAWFEIQEVGTLAIQVVLRTELDSDDFSFSDIIRLLHEEGADIVNANYTVVEDAVIHTIHCEVEESVNFAAMISERLRSF